MRACVYARPLSLTLRLRAFFTLGQSQRWFLFSFGGTLSAVIDAWAHFNTLPWPAMSHKTLHKTYIHPLSISALRRNEGEIPVDSLQLRPIIFSSPRETLRQTGPEGDCWKIRLYSTADLT